MQFMIETITVQPALHAETEEEVDAELEVMGDDMKLTSLQSISDFMTCAGRTLTGQYQTCGPEEIWRLHGPRRCPRKSARHAQRALSIMMNVQWKSNYFEAIDPVGGPQDP